MEAVPGIETVPGGEARGLRPGSAEWIVGGVLLSVVVLVALIGPLVAPHAIDETVGLPGSPPGPGVPLGTDSLGRDVLSRVLHGGLGVVGFSIVVVLATYVVGVGIGLFAGLATSARVDNVMMRLVDLCMVFPPLLLLLVLIAGGGDAAWVLGIGIVIVLFPGVARLVRSATLTIAYTGYVESARLRGEGILYLMRREVLPNIAPAVLADLGARFAGVVILAASVNFLGLGAKPPSANWGLMVSENRDVFTTNMWAVTVPAALLALLTIAVNLLGDAYVRRWRWSTAR